ncbi:hypothetical protein CNR22_14225 [Sphingobacteriaceae bacterium]|nr:hypothetical protein CNR22_14225 [Sphingobacteriaceae bacterium]
MQNSHDLKRNQKGSSTVKVFRNSFIKELKFIYWAEKLLIKFLARAERAASTSYAKACLKGHKGATSEQIKRLERIFMLLNEKPAGKTCSEIKSLVNEAHQILKATEENTLSRDLGLLAIIQKMEHLEIIKYNSLINLANELGIFEIVLLLEKSIEEEFEAKEMFAAIAEDTLNDEKFQIRVSETSEEDDEFEHLEAV